MQGFISEGDGYILVRVRAVPKSRVRRESERFEISGDRLVVRLEEPPVGGRANRELRDVLAEMLGVRRRDVEIVKGEHSRDKVVRVSGVSKQTFLQKLKLWMGR